MVSDPVHFRKD